MLRACSFHVAFYHRLPFPQSSCKELRLVWNSKMPQYSTSFASPSSELFCLRLLSIVRAAVRVVRSVCCSGCPGCILGLVDHSAGGTVSMPRSTRMLADVQSRSCIVLLVALHSRCILAQGRRKGNFKAIPYSVC